MLATGAIRNNQKGVLATQFEVEAPPSVNPDSISSIHFDFTLFELDVQYFDNKDDLSVRVNLDLEDVGSKSFEVDVPVKSKVDRRDISSKLPIVIDGIDASDEYINGKVEVIVTHPSVSEESYYQTFTVGAEIPSVAVEDFGDGNADDWDDPVEAVSSTENGGNPVSGSHIGELEIIGGSNKQFRKKDLPVTIYPSRLSLSARIENVDNQFDRFYISIGPFLISMRSQYSDIGIGGDNNTGVSLLDSDKWYNIEFNGIDWVKKSVNEVLINGSVVFSDYSFSGSGISEYNISCKGGSTFQGYIDNIKPT